jgi:hypothetical protein
MQTELMSVTGMQCGGCTTKLSDALRASAGDLPRLGRSERAVRRASDFAQGIECGGRQHGFRSRWDRGDRWHDARPDHYG